MAERRQLFRFRLPWLSAAATSRPTAQTEVPSQPSTTTSIQQPPFRPPGIAPVQTAPMQARVPGQKTEPQPDATSRPATSRPTSTPRHKIRGSSVPPSASRRVTDKQGMSRPVSASHGTIQTQATSQTRSPARAISVPPSPSRMVSQPQSIAQAVSKQQSSSRLASQPAGQTSPQPSSPSLRDMSAPKDSPTAIQERSQPPSSTQPPPSASHQQTQPFGVAEIAPITGTTMETPSAPLKPKERVERKKVQEEHGKATAEGSTHEEPEQGTITKLLAAATDAGTKTKEQLMAALETGKRHQQKQDDMEIKKTLKTSSNDEKQIKTVSSAYPRNLSIPNKAHEKHVSSNWEQVPLQNEIRDDVCKFVHKLTAEQLELPTDEKSISVVTLAGENRGASFHLGSESSKKEGLVHIHRGYKINPDDSPDATTDGEESSRGRKPNASVTKENPASTAYANNNIQSINNSIVCESSVNARNPGVYLELIHNLAESTKSKAKEEHTEPGKTRFNITPAEKRTYEPTVRRRCLRGLFAESSDSDPGNPEKPRRHGCRFNCGGKNKQKEMEDL
ncbi:hypothetical protein ES319_A06G010000v1 [Gossypium barbadense]|uniref:Flocculation protein FLO11-like n=3 Tax=Gossypium TaxID=3633 RepID=A0A5J5V8M8_GOSBA|nr:hypothetical protein ES319_A06G010000v1 [Gossypium barbadense]TYH11756.1 hypothetical protein ES288_A06G011100v1 [Gossypium darwinii]TYI21044.1 hypothetical protein ES332_A06G010400v1 [Gossypium tomentosum]